MGTDTSLTCVEKQVNGCPVAIRRVYGPKACELFISCSPPAGFNQAGQQAEAIYEAIRSVLHSEGGSFASIVCETLFHRNVRANLELVREVRSRVVAATETRDAVSTLTEIEQPPLDDHAWFEVSIQAVLFKDTSTTFTAVRPGLSCSCSECLRAQGVVVKIDDESRLYSGALYGDGANVYEQTRDMFNRAEEMLRQAGMEFTDVVRTWIYLPDIDRDYADLNLSRREFFKQRNIDPPPASTGIGAGLVDRHLVCLRIYAVNGPHALYKTFMTTPTLNEAPSYGADFSRGMRIAESNRDILHVSGTASLDETGSTVHEGDFEAQANRMLVNVEGLLAAQGAVFADIVSAISYVKNTQDAQLLREIYRAKGYEGFAHVLVNAPVCRDELLCETEAIAILSRQ